MRRHAAPGRGPLMLLLSSGLALLALASFPIFAHADSSEVQYETALPEAGGHGSSNHEQVAHSSGSPGGGGGGGGTASGGSGSAGASGGSSGGEVSSSSGSGSHANGGGGGGGAASSQGSPSKHPGKGGAANVNGASPKAVEPAHTEAEEGGSSPLAAILIAIAVLAAISVGAYYLRQRRQRAADPSSLPTKAG